MRRTRKYPPQSTHARRGAALYMIVLTVAMIVSVLGLAGLKVARIERKRATSDGDMLHARANARSAVELALRVIANDSNWRTTHTNSVETALQSLGTNATGTVSWVLEDSDGSLTDTDTNLRLKGIGRVGNTVQVSSVKLDGTLPIPDTLQCSAYAVGNITQSSTSTTNGGPFASQSLLYVGSEIIGDAEGNPVTISGTGSVTGTVTDPGPNRTMPSAGVWDTYMALATPIPFTNFPVDPVNSNKREFNRQLLGATVNPFGPTDADGVYYIQIPAGKHLNVTKSRIHATLLIELGAGAKFDTQQSCMWDPYNGNNYPCAIVKSSGNADFDLMSSNATLKEQQAPKFNYNPPGEPYDGETDTDESDQRVPIMRGLFHIIGSGVNTTLASNLTIEGVFITEGALTLGANLTINVNPAIFSNPPLGYSAATGDMSAIAGTWLWDAAP
ncbi:MAG: hypothetical protein O3A00_22015 [Planctomycetota bacterium]|nr:hypothetical protein [Planctomycetota bacterium]